MQSVNNPVQYLSGLSTSQQHDILSNFNAYLTVEESRELEVELGLTTPIPEADKHVLHDDEWTKHRTRFANHLNTVKEDSTALQSSIDAFFRFMVKHKEQICIIGNGGAGVAGFVQLLAHEPEFHNYILIWHGGNSDVNFKHASALHMSITYEPHIEQAFVVAHGGQAEDVKTIFINKLKLYIPDDDPLNLVRNWNKHCKGKPMSPHLSLGLALFASAINKHGTLRDKAFGRYASRYNHSSIGEHDKMMFVHAANRLISSQYGCKLNLGFVNPQKEHRIERLSTLMGQTFVVANQTWYPPSVLDFSVQNGCYHLNDEVFFCNLLNDSQPKLKEFNVFDAVHIDNIAQLWMTPAYNNHTPSRNIFTYLTTPKTNKLFIEKFNDGIAKTSGREPIFPPRPGVDYVQNYLREQYSAQSTSPLAYMQNWSFTNYEASMYAEIVRNNGKFAVTRATFREKLNQLLEGRHQEDAKEDLQQLVDVGKQQQQLVQQQKGN